MFKLFVPSNLSSTMPTYQGSHRRPFLRLRIFPRLGGINLYQEVVSVWVGAETIVIKSIVRLSQTQYLLNKISYHSMEKYIVQFFGFNEDKEHRELLGSAFLVKPHFLITAAHVILDETGSRYENKGFLFDGLFYPLVKPSYIEHKERYYSDDKICHDLAIYKIDMELPNAFQLSTREVGYKERFTFFGKGGTDEDGNGIRKSFDVTISFNEYAPKFFERGKMIYVQNCIMIKEILSPGDSGAPIFSNEEVVGMIIYGIKDSERKSPTGNTYGTVAIKSTSIGSILEGIE
jgi:hypothetical protein